LGLLPWLDQFSFWRVCPVADEPPQCIDERRAMQWIFRDFRPENSTFRQVRPFLHKRRCTLVRVRS
jgi:hypothetical protein